MHRRLEVEAPAQLPQPARPSPSGLDGRNSPAVRHYDTGRAVRADVVDARVWLGIHFRFADVAARNLGAPVDW